MSRQSRERTSFRWRLYSVLSFMAAGIVAAVALVVIYTVAILPELPRLREAGEPDVNLATIVYTADGTEIARYYRENRTWVPYERISPHVVRALVATEDHRFYEHWGIDVRRMFGSAVKTMKGDRQGGSTITMQLARNLYPEVGKSVNLDRKIREVITAFKVERNYSKQEIIEMYLNTVPFGYNAFGIESAARTYFNKPAAELALDESATLVGMLKGTTRYNPMRNPDLARERRDVVLAQMVKHGVLSRADYTTYRGEPVRLEYTPTNLAKSMAPHFAEYVREYLEEWAGSNGYDLYADGLRVYTTLDNRMQEAANEAVRVQAGRLNEIAGNEWGAGGTPYARFWNTHPRIADEYLRGTARYGRLRASGLSHRATLQQLRQDPAFADSVRTARLRLEAGFVAIDPNSGHVKAWVGGRDFRKDQFDKVGLARRQPGSAFKPFVYAAAVDYGFSPAQKLTDTLMTVQLPGSSRTWTPRNHGGGASGAQVTLRDALVYSKNTITTQLVMNIGPAQVAGYARRLGITSPLQAVPSIGLGTSEVTLLELTAAYVPFAAGGLRRPPVLVTRILDREGNEVYTEEPRAEKALSMYTAYAMVDIMRDVINRGTGAAIRSNYGIREDVAGKTGTTQGNADGWFVMMHPGLVMGAWVGFNDRRLAFRSDHWGQGGHNALTLVGAFFRDVIRDTDLLPEGTRFTQPPGYFEAQPYDETQDDYYLAGDTTSYDRYYDDAYLEYSYTSDSTAYGEDSSGYTLTRQETTTDRPAAPVDGDEQRRSFLLQAGASATAASTLPDHTEPAEVMEENAGEEVQDDPIPEIAPDSSNGP